MCSPTFRALSESVLRAASSSATEVHIRAISSAKLQLARTLSLYVSLNWSRFVVRSMT